MNLPYTFSTHQTQTKILLPMLAAGALLSFPAQPPAIAQSATQANSTDVPAIDPAAMDALNKMGVYLRTLQSFQVKANVTQDDVTNDGQVIESTSTIDLLTARPNRFRAEIISDDQHRFFFFDGKNFTIYGRLVNYYATVPAPPTIAELISNASDKYGIDLPLNDLFTWGTDEEKIKKITSAMDVGPSTVDGVTCQHYAFRQEGIDWQIWIQLGEFPLPRRLVIRTITDDAKPRYSENLSWNLAPSFSDNAFTFDPPPGVQRIPMEVKPASTEVSK